MAWSKAARDAAAESRRRHGGHRGGIKNSYAKNPHGPIGFAPPTYAGDTSAIDASRRRRQNQLRGLKKSLGGTGSLRKARSDPARNELVRKFNKR